MNEFHEHHVHGSAGRDPLERLVEAFVELSVPEGPDPAIQRSLVTTLRAAPLERTVTPRRAAAEPSWRRSHTFQALAVAAGVLALATAALLAVWQFDGGDGVPAPSVEQMASNDGQTSDPIDDEAMEPFDVRLQASVRPASSNAEFFAMLNVVLRERSDLSKSDGWRRAQQGLAGALERPEVIGVGVGLLGTLPWATHGRF